VVEAAEAEVVAEEEAAEPEAEAVAEAEAVVPEALGDRAS
jgi:hypothetical protein